MSVAVIPMAADLGWSPSDRGLVNSAFFWGYSLTQIPAGWVSTRWVYISAPEHCENLLQSHYKGKLCTGHRIAILSA
jgi:MFS family permease